VKITQAQLILKQNIVLVKVAGHRELGSFEVHGNIIEQAERKPVCNIIGRTTSLKYLSQTGTLLQHLKHEFS